MATSRQPIPYVGSSKLYIPDVTVAPLHRAYEVSQNAIDSFEQTIKDAINTIANNASVSADAILQQQQSYVQSAIDGARAAADTATGAAEDQLQGHLAWLITIADDLGLPEAPMVAAARGRIVPTQITATGSEYLAPSEQLAMSGQPAAVAAVLPSTLAAVPPTGLGPGIFFPTPLPPAPPPQPQGSCTGDINYWGEFAPNTNFCLTQVCGQNPPATIYQSVIGPPLGPGSPGVPGVFLLADSGPSIIIGESTQIFFAYVDASGNAYPATEAQFKAQAPVGPAGTVIQWSSCVASCKRCCRQPLV